MTLARRRLDIQKAIQIFTMCDQESDLYPIQACLQDAVYVDCMRKSFLPQLMFLTRRTS
jgi:hypothetical protein